MAGRLGVTDADLMEKAFSPVFKAEDLTKQGNYQAIAKVMMYNLPSAPFTMSLVPPMGEANPQLLETMKAYSAAKYAKTREEVEKEIKARWKAEEKAATEVKNEVEAGAGYDGKVGFLESWKQKKAEISQSMAGGSDEGHGEAQEGVSEAKSVSVGGLEQKSQGEALDSLKAQEAEMFKVR